LSFIVLCAAAAAADVCEGTSGSGAHMQQSKHQADKSQEEHAGRRQETAAATDGLDLLAARLQMAPGDVR
jgi:hypothetical protein